MNLTEIINQITQSECAFCKFGKALIALRDLRDGDPQETDAPTDKEKLSVPQKAAAPKSKLQPKTAKAKPTLPKVRMVGAPAETPMKAELRILDYMKKQSGLVSTVDIADAVDLSVSGVGYHLRKLKEAKSVEMTGAGALTMWSLRPARASVPDPDPQRPASIIRCKLCDYRALDQARLDSHMKTSHGAAAL